MLCAIAFCESDSGLAKRLIEWIIALGSCKSHDCLLVADAAVPWPIGREIQSISKQAFGSVSVITNRQSVKGWIPGSVSLFWAACKCANDREFIFIEPDAVPLRHGWLDEIEAAYKLCGKLYMGAVVRHNQLNWPNPYLEGVAVYPPRAAALMGQGYNPNVSWTKSCASLVIPHAFNTPLIQHLWGEKDNAPTFAEQNIPGTNVFALNQIRPEACIFHRCKDASLINLLRKKFNMAVPERKKIMVVLPFCNKDAALFVKNLTWMRELDGHLDYDAVLSFDTSTQPGCVNSMKQAARVLFNNVSVCVYPQPKAPYFIPTMAFIAAAKHMHQKHDRAWLWCEFDEIPLKRGWLDTLNNEYHLAGKPFMAPIVPLRGHANGTAIYPHDTPILLRNAFKQTMTAWDVAAKPEMVPLCHDCSNIFQHVWGMHQGKFHPYLGPFPDFSNPQLMAQLNPNAVIFHHAKNGALIDRLRERK